MRVVIHPADEGGCGSYRLIWPGQALAAQGHDVRVLFDETYPVVCTAGLMGERERVLGLADPKKMRQLTAAGRSELALLSKRRAPILEVARAERRFTTEVEALIASTGPSQIDADVYVFQRPLQRHRVEFIEAIQATGAAVVVEVDDDFHAIHKRNPAWRHSSPLRDRDANRDWLMRACEIADLVTVSTPALARRYGAHGRVRVLANCIPERYLSVQPGAYTAAHLGPKPDGVTVGWSGSVATHPGDLEVTDGAVGRALAETGARFEVVGTGVRVGEALGLGADPPATGWLPIEAYPEALARHDIGLAPLQDVPFNAAKSALKMMEYAAVGSAPVGSPSPENQRMADLGVGVVCRDGDEWRATLVSLIQSPAHRADVKERARQVMRAWTIEANAWRWAEAWADAHALSRQRTAA